MYKDRLPLQVISEWELLPAKKAFPFKTARVFEYTNNKARVSEVFLDGDYKGEDIGSVLIDCELKIKDEKVVKGNLRDVKSKLLEALSVEFSAAEI